MRTCALVLCIAACAASAFAQSEFIVNTTQDSTQRDPQIERDGAGNYVVVWKAEDYAGIGSHGDIVLQFFSNTGAMIGGEVLVNTTTPGNQEKPAAAMNAAGDLVVTWASMTGLDSAYDIMARIFHNRVPAGPEFVVNTTRRLTQTEPDAAIDSAGNVLIAWDTWTETTDREVMARLYGADGNPKTGEFMVNTTMAYSQARPAVKFFRNGAFVVAWESWMQDGSGYGVYGRRFAANGAPLSGEFQVNTTTADYQWFADVETFDDGGFIVVWCSWGQDGSEGGIYMQRFAADGSKISGEVQVNTTTAWYQWLPRIRKFSDGGFAVIWSSWKQDGSREGVYCQLFDKNARKISFETPVNTTTESFQWEPDLVTTGPRALTAVWSSWGQLGKDYDIVGRNIAPVLPQGIVNPVSYTHSAGRSTSRIVVHVVDSLALTGQSYEATFDTLAGGTQAVLHVRNTSTGDSVIQRYPIDRGTGVFYLTPAFQGVTLEVIPEFTLDLDFQRSYFANHSGTNLSFVVGYPTAGLKKIAPIDVALIWGRTDTLADGSYAAPSDSALPATGSQKVMVPFTAWNLTDNAHVDLVVVETRSDRKWNPGEKINFRTPAQYRTATNNTQGEIRPMAPDGAVVMPAPGDTNYLFTTRPIQQGEKYTFSTSRALVLDAPGGSSFPAAFALQQNFPNPFNPATTIRYVIPAAGQVRLDVFNVIGQLVATLVDGRQDAGTYRAQFDARGVASGVYFYRLTWEGAVAVQKMVVLK